MIIGSFQSTALFFSDNHQIEEDFDEAGVDILEILPDPNFNIPPEVVVVGDSGEFSALHIKADGTGDNYMSITWDHTPNTALDYIGRDPEVTIPDYNDYIYVYQEFSWPYNQIPSDVDFLINYSTIRTGDFAEGAQPGNNLMFRVYVWAIDSLENWVMIYESREAVYTEIFQEKRVSLNYFNIQDIFAGMVETGGVQEDPEDNVKLAIGIAPRYLFEDSAWTYYDGSVTIQITYADIYPFINVERDPATVMQPEYNATYGTTVGDTFPNNPNASTPLSESCYGITAGDDGSVYVTGNIRSSYELYVGEGLRFHNQFLLKYNPTLQLQWAKKNDNNTSVRSITYQNGSIYTTGYKETDYNMNMIITKWSTTGGKVWEKEWGGYFSQVGVGIAVQENGSIYVVTNDYDSTQSRGNGSTSLLKYDNDGNLIWEKSIPSILLFHDDSGDLYIQGEYLYFLYSGYGTILNLEGDYITGFAARTMIPDGGNGFFFAVRDSIAGIIDSSHVRVYHVNATGYPIWNSTYVYQWPNGQYQYSIPLLMAVTPDDTLLLLMIDFVLGIKNVLLTYNLEGVLLDNQTIFSEDNAAAISNNVFMAVGTGGRVYFAFDVQELDLSQSFGTTDICVQAYRLYDTKLGFTLTIPMVISIGSTIVIVGVIVEIFRKERKS